VFTALLYRSLMGLRYTEFTGLALAPGPLMRFGHGIMPSALTPSPSLNLVKRTENPLQCSGTQ
jgi:hypothetical protein